MSTPLLSVRDLSIAFPQHNRGWRRAPDIPAVSGVNFDIAAGSVLGLVGESGSGKSTVARAILGLGPVSGGSITFDGIDLPAFRAKNPRTVGVRIQAVFQNPYASLNPGFSVGETLIRSARQRHPTLSKSDLGQLTVRLMERVGLSPGLLSRRPRALSGGQRQRVAIARALSVDPDLLVCDEPTSALDMTARAQIVNLLVELQQESSFSMLFITHDLPLSRYLCDDIAVMRRGGIVEMGTAAAVFDNPRDDYTRLLLAAAPPSLQALRNSSANPPVSPLLSEKKIS